MLRERPRQRIGCTKREWYTSIKDGIVSKDAYLVFASDNFLDQNASTKLNYVGAIERARDLTTYDEGQSFYTFEISMLDRLDALLANRDLG
ncbi:hypothetical protein SCLCIDRAFT_769129 [Scleroderma citrinum Foug A]|uniref:Uncharacterized protein n=1 Tax=Scleroderma citrinum Foug A TaxID=1036808 RepID=A0A0C2ZNK6_9AGAM|nr:hypothetical protein SCLCIDRAFT_769129 [Scleroderma citrinum Foug A]